MKPKLTLTEFIGLSTFSLISIYGFISFLIPSMRDLINLTLMLELFFFTLIILNISFKNGKNTLIAFGIFFATSIVILFSIEKNVPNLELLRSIKWLIYLTALNLVGGRNSFSIETMVKIFKLLSTSMITVYLLTYLKGEFNVRPKLITENNYEVILLLGIYTLIFFTNKNLLNLRWLIVVGSVCLLSQSRSGIIGFLFLFIWIGISQSQSVNSKLVKNFRFKLSNLPILIILAILTNLIIQFRGSSITNSDRFKFFQLFLSEMSSRNVIEWLIGRGHIEILSQVTCTQLRYYESLISNLIMGTCYSVVLHSFILRVIWDFGFIGLILSIVLPYSRLKQVCTGNFALPLTILALINGFSVSGVNNVYVMIPMLFAIILRNSISSARNFNSYWTSVYCLVMFSGMINSYQSTF